MEKKPVTFNLTHVVHKAVKLRAVEESRPMSDVVEDALREALPRELLERCADEGNREEG